MIAILKSLKPLLGLVFFLSLVGCSDDNGTSQQDVATQSISGYVVDGYISGAKVCIDLNRNDVCDIGEPTNTSDVNGSYTLETTSFGNGLALIAHGGVDTATNKAQPHAYKAHISLEKEAQLQSNITLLTSIATHLYLQKSEEDSNYSYEDAQSELATALGVSTDDIGADPMQDNALFAKTQRIVQTSTLLESLLDSDTTDLLALSQTVAMTPVENLAEVLDVQIDTTLQRDLAALEQTILYALDTNDSTQAKADTQNELSTNIEQIKESLENNETYTSGSIINPYTYSWTLGEWGACEGECGENNALQSRTVTCQASTGESVADGMCSEPKPATTQVCTASLCPVITYSWILGEWGACSGDCGTDNATQSRTVTCQASTGESVADGMCSEPKPATTQACTASICPLPVMGDIPNQSLLVSEAVNIDVSSYVTLAEGDAVTTYTLTGALPTGLSFDTNTGVLSGTPTVAGAFDLSLTATGQYGVSNSDSFSITLEIPRAEIYIRSAVYDSNGTVDGGDDTLFLYFNTDISTSTLASNLADSFIINGGALSSSATWEYEAQPFHKLTISLNDLGTSQNPIDVSDANISLVDEGVRDADGNYPQDFNVTVIQKLQIVKKTGQLFSYDVNGGMVFYEGGSVKDDGYYQKGKAPRYTRDDTSDIVTDELTGLMWQDNNSTNTNCSELTLGGYDDWRLPNISELGEIVEYGHSDAEGPAINTLFQNTNSALYYYYTSSTHNAVGQVYRIAFYDGKIDAGSIALIRCVREKE